MSSETFSPAPPGDGAPVIRVVDLEKVYGRGAAEVTALSGVSLEVWPGEFVSIMGASGSGKSTLIHVLGCLHKPTEGRYELDGQSVVALPDRELSRLRNAKIGVVFQRHNLLPHEDIVSNAALPLVYARVDARERQRRAGELLVRLGLGDRLRHRPSELSGGQEQRVAIARALINSPAVILADEPTGSLDSETGLEIMAILQKLNRSGRTIIQVTHDREKAEFAGRIVNLHDGKIEREETVESPRRAPDVDVQVEGLDGGRP